MEHHHLLHHHQQLKLNQHMTQTQTQPQPQPQPQPLTYDPPVVGEISRNKDEEGEVEERKNGVVLISATPSAVHGGGGRGGELQVTEILNLSPIGGRPRSGKLNSPSGVRYKECLKNHAASMGTTVVDGCGEFMPSGKEGTLEALKCAACQCHRNFHRRELEGHSANLILHPLHLPFHHHNHQLVQPMSVAYGGAHGGGTESSSEDLVQVFDEMPHTETGSGRKRFRTKFTQEQKAKMLEFADKLGWRLQRQDDEMVERFCNEVGVRRQVLKVWMHNNKNSFKKQPPLLLPAEAQQHHIQEGERSSVN